MLSKRTGCCQAEIPDVPVVCLCVTGAHSLRLLLTISDKASIWRYKGITAQKISHFPHRPCQNFLLLRRVAKNRSGPGMRLGHFSIPPQRYLSARWAHFHAVYTQKEAIWRQCAHTYEEQQVCPPKPKYCISCICLPLIIHCVFKCFISKLK